MILFYIIYYLVMFICILVHDYNLSFIGSPCYNVGCYKYNSIRSYYVIILCNIYWFEKYLLLMKGDSKYSSIGLYLV